MKSQDLDWVPEPEYEAILARVPIACVDLLALTNMPPGRVGLILRATYAGNMGWCLIGGAVKRNRSLVSEVQRHVNETLGGDVELAVHTLKRVDVCEYFSVHRPGELYDPRKHAISVTYTGDLVGDPAITARGEAVDFRWFDPDELPRIKQLTNHDYGFGQGVVISRVLGVRTSPEGTQ